MSRRSAAATTTVLTPSLEKMLLLSRRQPATTEQELYGELLTTAQQPDHMPATEQRFAHCCPGDFSASDSGRSILWMLHRTTNPPRTRAIVSRQAAGQDLQRTRGPPFPQSLRKVVTGGHPGPAQEPGKNPVVTKVGRGQRRAPVGAKVTGDASRDPFSPTPVTEQAPRIVTGGGNAADFPCPSADGAAKGR